MKRKRWLMAIALTLLVLASLVYVLWRQEVGYRASPRPSQITASMYANPSGLPRERPDALGVPQIWIPGGWFRRGADPLRQFWARAEETPEHDVHVVQGFWMDTFEVTTARFDDFLKAGGYVRRELWSDEGWAWKGGRAGPGTPPRDGFSDPEQPRVWVTWYEAEAYARWRGGRLPTEAEWEYAARGPRGHLYPWGDQWDERGANTSERGVGHPLPVGNFPTGRSWCGVHDLCGNVWEWVSDWFDANAYEQAQPANPVGPQNGGERIVRSGSWGGPRESARTTRRGHRLPVQPSLAIGFRIVSEEAGTPGWPGQAKQF